MDLFVLWILIVAILLPFWGRKKISSDAFLLLSLGSAALCWVFPGNWIAFVVCTLGGLVVFAVTFDLWFPGEDPVEQQVKKNGEEIEKLNLTLGKED